VEVPGEIISYWGALCLNFNEDTRFANAEIIMSFFTFSAAPFAVFKVNTS
jgi:hypothetical protein